MSGLDQKLLFVQRGLRWPLQRTPCVQRPSGPSPQGDGKKRQGPGFKAVLYFLHLQWSLLYGQGRLLFIAVFLRRQTVSQNVGVIGPDVVDLGFTV